MKFGFKTHQNGRMLSMRERVLCTVLILILYRLLAHIPLPFVNADYVSALLDNNGSLTFFNTLTGGGFENMSFVALGITPYISASIIIQLMGVVIPRLADMQKEGATGRQTIERISIVLAAVLGFLQAICMTWNYGKQGLLSSYTWYTVLIPAILMTVGVFVLSFAGQMIQKHFFGNGISLILLTGILCSYFSDANSLLDALMVSNKWLTVLYCVIAVVAVLALFWFAFYLNACEKRIPVTYSQRISAGGSSQTQSSVIPLKLLSGSVVPIIFASSIITMPSLIQSFTGTDYKWLWIFNSSYWFNKTAPWASVGILLYCLMIIWFSYYYNSLNLNEVELASNLKKHGGYVHGIRPGKPTSDYLKRQMKYMTFIGACGLCIIAMVPNVVTALLNLSRLSFLGTSIIITVSVIVETKRTFLTEYNSYGFHTKSLRNIPKSRSLFGDSFKKSKGLTSGFSLNKNKEQGVVEK